MNKKFLSSGLLVCLSFSVQAQKAVFGVKAGGALTRFTGSASDDNFKYKVGLNAGALVNFGLTNRFSIQPELLYSMKGNKYSFEFGQSDGTSVVYSTVNVRQTLHYVDIPVLAHIKAGGLFFELGPQLGFLVAATTKIDDDVAGLPNSSSSKSGFKAVDANYVGGFGYQFPAGIGVALRYNGGLVDINKQVFRTGSLHNRALQFYLNYFFSSK